ncbi:MAG: DUF2892 domain-containing protein [Devosiaceae bacterium]|nr:DUF2892 domain-containing protein [Devosiaceae bacterium]
MNKNSGTIDRAVRLILGVVLLGLAWYYWAGLGLIWGGLLVIVGLVALITSFMGSCPLYSVLGINTCKTK